MSTMARALMAMGLGLGSFDLMASSPMQFSSSPSTPFGGGGFSEGPLVLDRPDRRSESVKAAAERYEAREWRGRSNGRRGKKR